MKFLIGEYLYQLYDLEYFLTLKSIQATLSLAMLTEMMPFQKSRYSLFSLAHHTRRSYN